MKFSKEEKARRKEAFREMSVLQKADYIFTYYKLPIFLIALAIIIVTTSVHRALTKKEPSVYVALINTAVGEDLLGQLTTGYLTYSHAGRRDDVYMYTDLYISEDADVINHEYAYASRMKLMGAISAKNLDLAVMNREAYDLFSQSGYLTDLPKLFEEIDDYDAGRLTPYLVENEVLVEDNTLEWTLNEADEHTVITETVTNGIELNDLPLFKAAGFEEPVYLGVIANSERIPSVVSYISYLLSEPS